jgi:hypothetical protein
MNMSYCRFQNTLTDLRDCREALEDFICQSPTDLGREEADAAMRLVMVCDEIANMVRVASDVKSDVRLSPSDIRYGLGLERESGDKTLTGAQKPV